MTLLGRAEGYEGGTLRLAPDLASSIAQGDANHLSVLDQADAHAARLGLALPEDPEARRIGPDPDCLRHPILRLDLRAEGVTAIVWATGYALDFGWLKAGRFDARGRPEHEKGVSPVPGLYVLGLPWLASRASAFIWGVWRDADHLAQHIAARAALPTPGP